MTKDKQETTGSISPGTRKKYWKFWILMLCVNIGFFCVMAKLFSIQILKHQDYQNIARRQHELKIPLSALRGNIYDRFGRLIASTVESVSIAVDPTVLQNLEASIELIAKAIDKPEKYVADKIKKAKGSFIWIARGIMPYMVEPLRENRDRGVLLISEPKRYFNYGADAAQIIGFTDYENNGLSGVELELDSFLRGTSGYMIMNRDGLNRLRPSAGLPIIPPLDGFSVRLSLDIELQRIVEYELKLGVLQNSAEAGTAIAIEPETGRILAMASYPNYDPNDRSKMTVESMRNRAITDVYEPGSTFKLITAAAAIEEGIVKPDDLFNGYQGALKVGNSTIRDVHGIGIVTFRQALEKSSNIILSTVANNIPDYKFYKYIRDFGFGINTGIDLPGEVTGTIIKPDKFKAYTKRFMGFGYGVATSPLQICNAYAAVANKGVLMKPYVIESVFNSKGEKIFSAKPEKVRRVISDKTAATMNDLFCGIVNVGTGTTARIQGMSIAGKTGTTQQLVDGNYSKSNYTASFVGFYPADNPKIAMLVVLDKPRASIYGGAVAAPIFKNIAARWVNSSKEYASYRSELAHKLKYNQANQDTATVIMPELRGLSHAQAEETLLPIGLFPPKGNHDGLIITQEPAPNTPIRRGTTVKFEATSDPAMLKSSLNARQNLVGLPLRRAAAILQRSGVLVKAQGGGFVYKQIWNQSSGGKNICTLLCK